jgi:bacteriocin-like protein
MIELNETELTEITGGMTCEQANATADVLQTIARNIGLTPGVNAAYAAWWGGYASGWRSGGCPG